MSARADSVRSILYALGANLAIAAAKTVAAIATGSSAMLAEAIHSFADSGNQGLLLWGMKQAKRPPSPDYPLGWGKAVFFWSFVVALVLFSLGGVFSLYEGWHKLQQPEALSYPWAAVGVLAFGLVAETVSLRASSWPALCFCALNCRSTSHTRSQPPLPNHSGNWMRMMSVARIAPRSFI